MLTTEDMWMITEEPMGVTAMRAMTTTGNESPLFTASTLFDMPYIYISGCLSFSA